jgi:cell division protein FtsQ
LAQAKREARERRRAERLRTRRRRALLAVLALVLVTALSVALYRSQLFEIKSIEVVGNRELATAAVIERAAVPDGATLLRFPRRAIERRLREDPWVADAVVSRDLPSTLRIRIEERVPAALVDTGEAFWIVNQTGLVIAQASLDTTSPLVVVRDVPGFDPRPGRTSNSDALVNALRVLKGISPELASMVRAVSAPSVDETALFTATGVEVMVGEATELDRKSVLALDILAQEGAGVVFIDVRSTDRPISRGLGD